jgi:hypothetical protein
MNKEKIIFFGAIGLVILVMVIYGMSVFSKKETSSEDVDFAIPDLVEKEKSKEDYNSRLKKANKYQAPKEKQDLSKTAEFKTYTTDAKKEKSKPKVDKNKEAESGSKPKVDIKPKENLTPEKRKESPIEKEDESGGFGIVISERSGNGNKTASSAKNVQGGFVPAMLEEDTKIKNQSSVVFFLLQDVSIDGTVFKKNSILYGKASEYVNVFDIHINQIMNTDGNISSVNGLIVYDEKYSRGLPYEGKINESVKEGMDQTTSETSSSITSTVASGSGVGIASNAVDNTIKAITRKKEASINLYKGYKVFIKKE